MQSHLEFKIKQSKSSHNSYIRYKKLENNVEEIFYFNKTSENETIIVYDGVLLTCTNGCPEFRRDACKKPQCQKLPAFQPVPSVIKEIDFNPRDGVVPNGCGDCENPEDYDDPEYWEWYRNQYSISAKYYVEMDMCKGINTRSIIYLTKIIRTHYEYLLI